MKNISTYCLFLFLTILFSACNNIENDNSVLATAFGKKLYNTDLQWTDRDLTKTDSIEFQSAYINNWLMNEILLNEAKSTLKPSQDLTSLVKKYENSLFISELEKNYVEENISKEISQAEIDTFFAQNKEQFVLSESVVKVIMVIIDNKYYQDTLKTLWKTEDLPALNSYVKQNQGLGFLDVDKWHYKSELKSIIPPDLYGKITFSKKEMYSYDMEGQRYLIKVIDELKAKNVAPKSLIQENIRLRILHERSIQLVNNWKQELYNKNIQSKKIHIAGAF